MPQGFIQVALRIKETMFNLMISDNIPNVIQNLGIALLTILIPLAIAVLEDVNKKRRDQKNLLGGLDLYVILDEVFKIKRILFWISLLFVPLFFWSIASPQIRLLLITPLSIIGAISLGKTVLAGYQWVKGRIWDFRFSYLKSFRDYKDIENVWRSVWQTETINREDADLPNPNDEQKFFEVFVSQIENLFKNCEGINFAFKKRKEENILKLIPILLNDFLRFINNRSVFFLSYNCLPKILKWHFKAWKKNYEYLENDNKIERWSDYNEILRILDSILFKIEKRSLQGNMSFSFFKIFKEHVEKYKKEKIDDHYYIDYLFYLSGFCKKLFEDISNSPKHYSIWENYFPNEWKITKENLEKKSRIPWTMLNCFLEWSRDRICSSDLEEYDTILDDVLKELFPEVDPITFADILSFAMCPWSGKRTKIFIDRQRNFGLSRRMKTFSFVFNTIDEQSRKEKEKKFFEQMEGLEKVEKQKAIELGYYLFKNQFTPQKLEEYIKELEELKENYKEDSIKEDKRKRLLEIFKEMIRLTEGN